MIVLNNYRRCSLYIMPIVFVCSKFLPKEMLERILNASYLGIMTSEWNSTVLDPSTLSTGYSLYREVSSRTGKSAYTTVKSVTYVWHQGVRFKRGYLLKTCEYFKLFNTSQMN